MNGPCTQIYRAYFQTLQQARKVRDMLYATGKYYMVAQSGATPGGYTVSWRNCR